MEILTAADVEGAIDIATRLKREGRYDWFRGQLEPWPPYSTLLRRQLKDPDGWEQDTKPEIERYLSWLRATPGLERLARDREAALCVAQHYGLPTHYIDFTTEPAVAGFFAVDKCPPGATVRHCIYCLNTTDLA